MNKLYKIDFNKFYFQNEMYIPYIKLKTAPICRTNHHCNSKRRRNSIVVASNGLQHQELIEFCDCEAEGATLVRYGLWPASTDHPQVAFQLSLLELQRVLHMEAHVPLHAFCKSLQHLNPDYPEMMTVSFCKSNNIDP